MRDIEIELELNRHGLWHGQVHYQKYSVCVDIDYLVDVIEGNDKKKETKKKKKKKRSKQMTDLFVGQTLNEFEKNLMMLNKKNLSRKDQHL